MGANDCTPQSHHCPYGKITPKQAVGSVLPTLAGWAAVLLTALAMLWNLAGMLSDLKARQQATDSKIDLILGALHLTPSMPGSVPANVSAKKE